MSNELYQELNVGLTGSRDGSYDRGNFGAGPGEKILPLVAAKAITSFSSGTSITSLFVCRRQAQGGQEKMPVSDRQNLRPWPIQVVRQPPRYESSYYVAPVCSHAPAELMVEGGSSSGQRDVVRISAVFWLFGRSVPQCAKNNRTPDRRTAPQILPRGEPSGHSASVSIAKKIAPQAAESSLKSLSFFDTFARFPPHFPTFPRA